MAASGERSADRKALVEAASGAVHDQDRRSRADRCMLDRSARRRHELARANEPRASGNEISSIEAVAHGGARRSEREHAEAEFVLRTAHSPSRYAARAASGIRITAYVGRRSEMHSCACGVVCVTE